VALHGFGERAVSGFRSRAAGLDGFGSSGGVFLTTEKDESTEGKRIYLSWKLQRAIGLPSCLFHRSVSVNAA
jgi:hypothetical protein